MAKPKEKKVKITITVARRTLVELDKAALADHRCRSSQADYLLAKLVGQPAQNL